jgi:hypothetical protein
MQHVLAAVNIDSEDWANYRTAAGSQESGLLTHCQVVISIVVTSAY